MDRSAPHIVGRHLLGRSRAPLDRLARSPVPRERRVAMLATQAFIRAGEVAPTLRLAGCLLGGPEDLIHKASGWMLRYAIERPPATVRARYLAVRGAARRRVAS